jgi:DnaJ family protein C protein 28
MSSVEKHIRRAMEQGKFEDLPGKGKPLNLDENPLEDPDWRLAYQMLRNSGFTLPWIETAREIEKEWESMRQSLARSWIWHQAAQTSGENPEEIDYEWQQAVEGFRKQITVLNALIFSYNLNVPAERFQKPILNADREINRLTSQGLSDKL